MRADRTAEMYARQNESLKKKNVLLTKENAFFKSELKKLGWTPPTPAKKTTKKKTTRKKKSSKKKASAKK